MASYSEKAQPYLDAIGAALFTREEVRNWLLAGTRHEMAYTSAKSLHEEQKRRRGAIKQPFFCNYFCMSCEKNANCGIPFPDGQRRTETDMMAFLENAQGRRLGIHIEFKHDDEPLRPFQAEAYPRRAECWATLGYAPRSIVSHHDWLTVIFCGDDVRDTHEMNPFERRVGHGEARSMIEGYPNP